MITEHYLTPEYMAREVAQLVAECCSGEAAGRWHRFDWSHPLSELRLDPDEHSEKYLKPALQKADVTNWNPIPAIEHPPSFCASVVSDGISASVIGAYNIETDAYDFAAFFMIERAVAA